MNKKIKVCKDRFEDRYIFRNENYGVVMQRNEILLFEKGIGREFLTIDTVAIEKFHIEKILSQFGFELVKGYAVLNNEKEFLEHFQGNNIGIIKDVTGGNLFVGILVMQTYSKEYLEEEYHVIINF